MLGWMLGSPPMRAGGPAGIVAAMEASAEVGLTIERGSDPIAGSLELPGGLTVRFEGYVQLVAALEGVREPPLPDQNDEGGTR